METGITAVFIGGGQKALVPVSGRPLLEHQLEWLKRAGIDSAVLCLDFQPEKVRARFADGSGQGMRLRYLVADFPRGTAGLIKALGPASLPEDVLVLFGGILPETDCGRMVRFHRSHQGLATLALHECRANLRTRPDACGGEPVVLGPAQRIVDFPRYAPAGQAGLLLSPLWIIRRRLFHFIPDGPASDLVKDVFPAAVKAGEVLLGYREIPHGQA
jgi:mannose-1-phosphate guanylyltransferase/phosphomannomutase